MAMLGCGGMAHLYLPVFKYLKDNQLKAFCECILNDAEPGVTGEDGLHVMEAVIAAYVSSLKGVKARLPFRGGCRFKRTLQGDKREGEKRLEVRLFY